MNESLHPHVTVATVVSNQNKFLFVREKSKGKDVLNQPAGHLELNETLIEAATRETYEETGYRVRITGYLGVSQFSSPLNGVTYIRHSFVGEIVEHDASAKLDEDILEALWLTPEELSSRPEALRSPMVKNDLQRFLDKQIFSTNMISVLCFTD